MFILGHTALYGILTPATTQPVGTGCGGANGVPLLTSDAPHLGNRAFTLELLSARPASACALFLSDQTQNLALGGGCSVYVGGTIIALASVTTAHRVAQYPLPIPLDSALRDVTLFAQAVAADPGGPVLGLTFTPGRRLVVGD